MLAPEISEESTKTVLLAPALQGLSCERVFGDSMTPELHAGLQSENSHRRQYIRLIKDKKSCLSAARTLRTSLGSGLPSKGGIG